ncbi:MAG: hypothetical protein AAF600_11930 [Bacteroidota bacterium]
MTICGSKFQKNTLHELKTSFSFKRYCFLRDTNYGNITTITPRDGMPKEYIWGYENSLVIASIENSGEAQAQRTDYTHIPLVGISSIEDHNNFKTTYEYDSRNRLRLILDQDANIVDRYRYNYGGQDNTPISADIEIENEIVRTPITFKATNISAYGGMDNTTFAWTIDGVTIVRSGSNTHI